MLERLIRAFLVGGGVSVTCAWTWLDAFPATDPRRPVGRQVARGHLCAPGQPARGHHRAALRHTILFGGAADRTWRAARATRYFLQCTGWCVRGRSATDVEPSAWRASDVPARCSGRMAVAAPSGPVSVRRRDRGGNRIIAIEPRDLAAGNDREPQGNGQVLGPTDSEAYFRSPASGPRRSPILRQGKGT